MQGLDRLVRSAETGLPPAISLVPPDATAARRVPSEAVLTARVRLAAWCFLPLAAMAEAIFSRHTMNPDGVSYLDMGDAIVRGDWKVAINGYWSPLYPLLQGLALKLMKPSPYLQFSVVHFVNFLIFLFTLGCFDFLLRAAVANRSWIVEPEGATGRLPRWAVFAVGYSVFLWSSLTLTKVATVSPDMLMTGLLYLAVGLLLRIWARPESFSRFAWLGGILALGYLAKVAVFPLCFIFFSLAWILGGKWRKATPRVLVAALVFLAVSGPWIAALSRAKGRFTYGDSGRVNYVLWVDGASPSYYFHDLGVAGGHYVHPMRQIFDSPTVYEFASPDFARPGQVTTPAWYDASYWAEGAVPRVLLKQQLSVLSANLHYYFDLLFTSQAALCIGFVLLCALAGRYLVLKQITERWPVWLIGLAGLAMFALVHVELRYIAVFFTLFWVGLFSGLKIPAGHDGQRLAWIVTLVVAVAMSLPTALAVGGHFLDGLGKQPNDQWQVAAGLRGMGVMPGDRVARIGGGFGAVYWARLLGVTEVAEVPDENSVDFWGAKPEVQAQVIETFRRLGVTAVVADVTLEPHTPGPEWRKIGDGYFALRVLPSVGPQDASAAVRASQELVRLAKINQPTTDQPK